MESGSPFRELRSSLSVIWEAGDAEKRTRVIQAWFQVLGQARMSLAQSLKCEDAWSICGDRKLTAGQALCRMGPQRDKEMI